MSNFDQSLKTGWKVWTDDSPEKPSAEADPRWIRELDQITGSGPRKTRTLTVKTLVPLLLSAQKQNATWLDDFADDVVVIDADLHEVLLAFEKLQSESKMQPPRDRHRRIAA